MRRKIAKRKRRYILKRGGVIINEGWWYIDPEMKIKDGFSSHIKYQGWTIMAVGRDELEAYKNAISCFDDCDKNPYGETVQVGDKEISVTTISTLSSMLY